MSPQKQKQKRPNFGERINTWLAEDEGHQFERNKWKFWFIALIGFQIINAALTAAIFATGDSITSYIGGIVLAIGVLLAWLSVCFLHYSDGHDRELARRVAWLDSITLVFAAGHLCLLLYVLGHVAALKSAEVKYEAQATKYNEKAEKVSGDNVQIAKSAENISVHNEKAERLRNDTAYQTRKAAEAGARLPGQRTDSGIAPSLSTATVELEKPEKPKKSSVEFLTDWDFWIRCANFGELALAVMTLIVIRNQSAKTNTGRPAGQRAQAEDDFPDELDTEARTPAQRPEFATMPVSSERRKTPKTPKTHASFDSEGLKRLRAALKDISFRLSGHSFKVDKKSDAVWIRLMKANNGTQQTVSTAKAKLDILTDAVTMPRSAFRERLEKFLRENGFEI